MFHKLYGLKHFDKKDWNNFVKNKEYINYNICENDEPEAVELIEYFMDEHAKHDDKFYWWNE